MSIQLFQTKLNIPPVNNHIISREHLNKLLKNDMQFKLILVSSQAGSGKTTIITEYINKNNINCFWYSLDKTDNDLFRFFCYLVKGLERNQKLKNVNFQELLDSFQSIGEMTLIRTIINVMQSTAKEFTLVFDDYHLIKLPSIHSIMKELLEHLPPNIHMIIISREDPSLPLSKLRVKNQLLEIRVNDLKFTNSEAESFLNQSMKLQLSAKGVQTLNHRAEGWIAGLQLAALYIRGHQDKEQFIADFSGNHYYIMDYLLEEVLQQQTPQIKEFLLCTSVLNQFCGSLCDEILRVENGTSQKILESLSQANVFIIPLDYQRTWFRYHHLFRDLLHQKLTDTSYSIKGLHALASGWYYKNDNIIEAIHHAISADDISCAADLIESIWAKMDQTLKGNQWFDLVKQLPEHVIRQRPVLNVGYAWALIDIGDMENCVERLEETQKLIESVKVCDAADHYVVYDKEQFELLPATISSAYAYIAAATGDSERVFIHANKALSQIPEDNRHRKGVVQMLLGFSYWGNGELNTALDIIKEGLINIVKANSPLSLSTFKLVIAELTMEMGFFKEAETIINNAIKPLSTDNKLPLALASLYLKLSEICLLKGNLDKAHDFLNLSREKGRDFALPDFEYKWYIMQARLLSAEELYAAALESLEEAKYRYYMNPMPEHISIDGLMADIYLKMHQPESGHGFSHQDFYSSEQDKLVYIKYLLYEYSENNKKSVLMKASELLEELFEQSLKQDRKRSTLDLMVYKAIIANVKNDKEQVAEYIKKAIDLAAAEAYVFPFINNKEYLSDIYCELYHKKELPRFLEPHIIDIKKENLNYSAVDANNTLVEPLSIREIEVLQLMSQGYSNQDICDKLFLALSTVKGYNSSIFAKLEVKRRTEAISKARELGLIK